MDYGLGRMSSNSMLGMTGGSGGHLIGNNLAGLENGGARMPSPNGGNSNSNNNSGGTDQVSMSSTFFLRH
jgi:hypothetical protein